VPPDFLAAVAAQQEVPLLLQVEQPARLRMERSEQEARIERGELQAAPALMWPPGLQVVLTLHNLL
jgi:hypothetical protein